jgi:hypothetical protein
MLIHPSTPPLRQIALLTLVLAAVACDAPDDADDGEGAGSSSTGDGEEDARLPDGPSLPLADVLNPARWNPVDVGVLSHDGSCPLNSTYFEIKLDNEDTANKNARSGWIGKSAQNVHFTWFRFCSVDGNQLLNLAANNDKTGHYMVLKLGTNCPNGSFNVVRFIDTQDVGDDSYVNDGDGPNARTGTGVRLHFCMFRGGAATMADFPTFETGFKYGVFARDMVKTLPNGAGNIFTDDENSANANDYEAVGFQGDATRIITSGADTRFYLARVR